MKILTLSFEFPRTSDDAIVSGEIKNAYNFITELDRQGHDVTVLNFTNNDYPDEYLLGNVKVKVMRDITLRGAVRYLYRANLVRKYLKANPDAFDIIHSHISYGTLGVLLSGVKRGKLITTPHGTNIPEIMTELTYSPKDLLRRVNANVQKYLDIYAFSRSDAIVSVSKYQLDEMKTIYSIPNEKTIVVYNGVNKAIYHPDDAPKHKNKVLFVGRACKKKGLDTMYELAKRYPSHEFTLVLGSPMFNTIGYELINKIKSLSNCQCLESVPEPELGVLYREHDVTLVPSRGYESLPTVILESIASGTPAISTNKWGNPEVILDTNLLFEEDNITDIARAMEYALADNAYSFDEAYDVKYLDEEVSKLLNHYN